MKREILHEKITVYRQLDSGNFEAGRKRYSGNGTLPPARDEQCGFLQVASKIRRHGCLTDGTDEGVGAGKRPPEKDVRRCAAACRGRAGGSCKKVVRLSLRAKMAKEAVNEKKISIRQACTSFSISERCFRYEPKLVDDNARIAELLLDLTQAHRNWGFGLCFLFLRNVKRGTAGTTSACTAFTGSLN